MGIAAAMQAQKDGSTTLGFLGGQTIRLIQVFQAGYQAGVASVDKSMTVQVCYIGGDTTAFNNPTAGHALSLKMYDADADVIYHASGASGAGLFQAAAEKKKYAIGVDSDQYLSASCSGEAVHPHLGAQAGRHGHVRLDQGGWATRAFKSGVQVFDLGERRGRVRDQQLAAAHVGHGDGDGSRAEEDRRRDDQGAHRAALGEAAVRLICLRPPG